MESKKLTNDEIQQQMEQIKDWVHQTTKIPDSSEDKNIDMLFKMFPFTDYKAAREFAAKVADIAERLAHYPTITFTWNYSTVVAWTPEMEGLTEEDFALAKEIDKI